MKILLSVFIILMSFSFVFSNSFQPTSQSQKDKIADEKNIIETVFRFQSKNLASKDNTIIYFLSLYDKDPDNKFMIRFQGLPRIKKYSQAVVNGIDGVKDKETGVSGLILQIKGIKWLNQNEVKVTGGYYEDGLSASGNTYTVKRIKGKWIVTKDDLKWIS
ncbi:MAG: hypothetical protein K1X72_19210 [Pyrinomonadaceae bacterium]|nr:hypothetical protein [Pyrinomonadaceae bacterium]